MLTRSQVARRLGKSIATVRRMEGKELHPVEDHRGVNRFEPDEVDQVALGRTSAAGADSRQPVVSEWFEDEPRRRQDTPSPDAELVDRISALEEELKRERRRALIQRQELERAQRVIADLRERLEMSANLLLEVLSPRQIKALGYNGARLLSYLSGAD